MSDLGRVKAYSYPAPNIRRPLRIQANSGPAPVYIVDKYGNPITSDDPFPVVQADIRSIDVNNSTSDPLPAGGEFVGVKVISTDFSAARVSILTDKDSYTGGLVIDHFASISDSEPVHSHCLTIDANDPDGMHAAFTLTGEAYRVRYKNGDEAQGKFYLQSSLSKDAPTLHTHNVLYPFSDNHTVTLTRSIIAGKKPDGTYDNAKLSADNAIFSHIDPHSEPGISFHMTRATGVTDVLAEPVNAGEDEIIVGNGAQWATGNKLFLPNEYDTLTIKGISTNTLTLDRELDTNHVVGEAVTGRDVNLARIGSRAAPLSYEFKPTRGLWHIHSMHFLWRSATEPALFRFGGISALQYGLHFRKVKPNDITRPYDTYYIPVRTLSALLLSGFGYFKEDKVLTDWTVDMKIQLVPDSNVVINLNAEEGEYFQCLLKDDNTGNTSTEIKLGVHEEPSAST